MNLAQAHVHADFARGVFQEFFQKLQDAFLLFQRPEQLAHFFLGKVQV